MINCAEGPLEGPESGTARRNHEKRSERVLLMRHVTKGRLIFSNDLCPASHVLRLADNSGQELTAAHTHAKDTVSGI